MVNKIRNTYFIQAIVFSCLFLLFISFGCSSENEKIARVNDKVLYENELRVYFQLLRLENTKENRKKVIDAWFKHQLALEELKEQDKQKYQQLRVQETMDLGELAMYHLQLKNLQNDKQIEISEKAIKDYYESHKEDFVLKDFIVKALYLKIPIEQKDLPDSKESLEQKIIKHYKLEDTKSLRAIEGIAKLYAKDYYYNDIEWAYFDDIFKDIPNEQFNKQSFVINRTKTYFKDQNFIYFINIIDYKLKSDNPPFDFLKDRIRQTILAEKLNVLKNDSESKLINKLKKKHEIEIYNH